MSLNFVVLYFSLFSFVYFIMFVFCICLTVEGLRARFGGVGGASKRYNRQAAVSYNGQQGCLTMGRAYAITPLQVIQVIQVIRTHSFTDTQSTYTHTNTNTITQNVEWHRMAYYGQGLRNYSFSSAFRGVPTWRKEHRLLRWPTLLSTTF